MDEGRLLEEAARKQLLNACGSLSYSSGSLRCRTFIDVIDETPAAYKSIDAVMAAQADLVEIVHTLRQVVCVKGLMRLRG